jgi:Domain of unknown function (DUF6265)
MIRATTLTLLVAVLTPALARAQEAPPAPLESLEWLAGTWEGQACWEGQADAEPFLAVYSTPAGGEVLSLSKSLDGQGRVAFFEFERFHTVDGQVLLTPYPGGQEAASFTLAEQGAEWVLFTNPDNDWPQSIRYARAEDGGLEVRVWGAPGAPALVLTLRPAP